MNDYSSTVLIIEDEPAIADNLIHVLEVDGLLTQWVNTASKGREFLRDNPVSLVILDVGLPDGNGFELCKEIRENSDVPIIFLTARNDEIDRIVGLEIGADDYVTKPFSPREVLARAKLRIKAHRSRSVPAPINAPSHCLEEGHDPAYPMSVNPLSNMIKDTSPLKEHNFDFTYQGKPLGLTAVEFKIMSKMVKQPSQIFSREQLMVAADMPAESVYERNIDTHIKSIRYKLKAVEHEKHIKTKRGFGYYYSTE